MKLAQPRRALREHPCVGSRSCTPRRSARQGVWFISQVVDEIGRRSAARHAVRSAVRGWCGSAASSPHSPTTGTPEVDRSRSAGVRRWLTGQLALFARYAPVVGMPTTGERARQPRQQSAGPCPPDEVTAIRGQLREHVQQLAEGRPSSPTTTRRSFADLFPAVRPVLPARLRRGAAGIRHRRRGESARVRALTRERPDCGARARARSRYRRRFRAPRSRPCSAFAWAVTRAGSRPPGGPRRTRSSGTPQWGVVS